MQSNVRIEHPIVVRGESAERVVGQAVQSLLTALGGAERADEDEAIFVVPFQASGGTIEALMQSLVDDIIGTVEASPAGLVDAEVSHVLKTDEGLRSWGILRFGTRQPLDQRVWSADEVSVSTHLGGSFQLRIVLLGYTINRVATSESDQ